MPGVTHVELRVSRTGTLYLLYLDARERIVATAVYRDWRQMLRETGRAVAASPRVFVRSDELDDRRARAGHADNREFLARGGY
jgi:hypothetical protein